MSPSRSVGLAIACIIALGLLLLGCGARPATVSPSEFYKTKTIDWSSPTAPGTTMDIISRIVQPVLARALGTNVIVTVRSGGGSIEALNHVWNSEPDGTHLSSHDLATLVLNQISGPTAQYDASKLGYISSYPLDYMLFFVAKDGPYQTIEALKAGKNLKLGGASPGGTYTLATLSVIPLLGLDAKVLTGLTSGKYGMMMAQRELDGAAMAATLAIQQEQVKPLFAMGKTRSPLYPNVPALGELVKFEDPERQRLLEWGDTLIAATRAVFTGPNVPRDKLEYLRDIFSREVNPQTAADLAKALKMDMGLEKFGSGENAARQVTSLLAARNELQQAFKSLLDKYRM